MMINKEEYVKNEDGAVVAQDISEYERYKLQRESVLKRKNLEQKVETLEKELNDLKSRLYHIENRLT